MRAERLIVANGEPALAGWRAVASPVLRLLHLLGSTMLLGSILGSIVLSLGAPATGDPQNVVFAWQAIGRANAILTTPGMLLVGLTGVGLMMVERRKPWEEGWLALKIVVMIATIANAYLLIDPAEEQLRQYAVALPTGDSRAMFANLAIRQQIFGAINLALIVLASVLGVVKPRMRRASSHGRMGGRGDAYFEQRIYMTGNEEMKHICGAFQQQRRPVRQLSVFGRCIAMLPGGLCGIKVLLSIGQIALSPQGRTASYDR